MTGKIIDGANKTDKPVNKEGVKYMTLRLVDYDICDKQAHTYLK